MKRTPQPARAAAVQDAYIQRRGLMLVLSSPSGAGKTTIARRLLAQEPALELSVSATTRAPRPGERDGVDYHFMDRATFEREAAKGAFLEYAEVFGKYYGTPRAPVDRTLDRGRDVLFDIDWQGTRQLAQTARADLVSVFVLPPSMEALEKRLRERGQDSEAVVRDRMAKAADEMSHWAEYDYIVVNEAMDDSVARVTAILHAERLRRDRQPGIGPFVAELTGTA